MIDITKPMFIYDDRNKDPDDIMIDRIIFQTGDFILCNAKTYLDQPLLINIKTGKVQNEDYWSWYLENKERK